MELDFSIRSTATTLNPIQCSDASDTVDQSSSSGDSLKRDAPSPSQESGLSTPEHVKRLRMELDAAFAEAEGVANEVQDVQWVQGVQGVQAATVVSSRPGTPPELAELSALIREASGDAKPAPPEPVPARDVPSGREDPFKHAGLMREYGGIKGWLELQRKEREAKGLCVSSKSDR